MNTTQGLHDADVLYVDALADTLQQEGADAFVQSWNDLLACLKEQSGAVARVR